MQTPIYLVVETSGSNAEHDYAKLEKFLEEAYEEEIIVDGTIAQDSGQQASIWALRENISEGLRHAGTPVTAAVAAAAVAAAIAAAVAAATAAAVTAATAAAVTAAIAVAVTAIWGSAVVVVELPVQVEELHGCLGEGCCSATVYCDSGSVHSAQKLYCSALTEPLLASSAAWPTYLADRC